MCAILTSEGRVIAVKIYVEPVITELVLLPTVWEGGISEFDCRYFPDCVARQCQACSLARSPSPRLERLSMVPCWVVSCPECNHEFTSHADKRIGRKGTPRPVRVASQDKCPNCNKSSIYGAFDLRYRDD